MNTVFIEVSTALTAKYPDTAASFALVSFLLVSTALTAKYPDTHQSPTITTVQFRFNSLNG